MRDWDAEVGNLITPEEREAFLNEAKNVKDLPGYVHAVGKHVKHSNESGRTVKVAKWIQPVLVYLNMIAPIAVNAAPVVHILSILVYYRCPFGGASPRNSLLKYNSAACR